MRRLTQTLSALTIIGLLISPCNGEEKKIGGAFQLTSHLNEPYASTDALGKIQLIFFGFTHCPEVCPNTLGTLQTVLNQLGEQAKQVQTVFITVDPQRDTPETLKDYLGYFSRHFIGLTGSPEEIDKVVKQFQGFYSYEGDITAGHYTVDHTSNLYILDTDGELTNIIPHGLPPRAITDVIKNLLTREAF